MIENAIIRSTFIGIEDHGCLTATVTVETASGVQAFGGRMFGTLEMASMVQAEAMSAFLRGVMRVIGASEWNEVSKRYIRVERRDVEGKIIKIGHITENRWFDLEE